MNFKWSHNNHYPSGLLKFSIVPLEDKCDGAKHKALSFYYTCWDRGEYDCTKEDLCHTDTKGSGWSGDIKIPDVLPDGEYIIGWLWYGGGKKEGGKMTGQWSDYYSCSHVTIKGGSMGKSWEVVFNPADSESAPQGGCLTASDEVGPCAKGEPCRSKPLFVGPPAEFKDGKKPNDLTPADFGGEVVEEPKEVPEPEEVETPASPTSTPSSKPPTPTPTLESSPEAPKPVVPAPISPLPANIPEIPEAPKPPVVNEPENVIAAFKLINAESDEILPTNLLTKSSWQFTIGTKELSSVNVLVEVLGADVENVKFFVNDELVGEEGTPPFAVAGNTGSNFRPWTEVEKGGKFELKVMAIGPDNVELDEKSVTIEFTV